MDRPGQNCEFCGEPMQYESCSAPYGSTVVDAGFWVCENSACRGEDEPECDICLLREWQRGEVFTITPYDPDLYWCWTCADIDAGTRRQSA